MIKKLCILGPAGFAATYMFYRSIWISFMGMAVFIIYGLLDKKNVKINRDRKMKTRFLDFLMCLEPLLKTSGTFSHAFTEAVTDYKRFHGKDEMCFYLDSAVNDFRINKLTSDVLESMAEKMDLEDARTFSGSMAVCEATGGNAVEVTSRTTELLVAKMRILCDIDTVLSGKVFEQKIITLMPFALIGLFTASAESYLEPLFSTIPGRIVMSAAGLLFLIQWFIGRKLMYIEV